MSPLDLQHFYELVVLLIELFDLGEPLLVAREPPVEGGALVADEGEDLKDGGSVVLDEGAGEVGDRDGQQVRVEVAVDVVYGVGQDGRGYGGHAQVGEDRLVGEVGAQGVGGALPDEWT